MSLEVDKGKVFLKLKNPVEKSPEKLHILASDLTNSRAIDQIGISVIWLSCMGCGYNPPEWIALEEYPGNNMPVLSAKVQIGLIGG